MFDFDIIIWIKQFIYLKVIIVAPERNRCTRLVISAAFARERVICFEHLILQDFNRWLTG